MWGRALLLALLSAGPCAAQTITEARLTDPTTRYDHGILGDAIEHGTLQLTLANGKVVRIVLPESRVFEDTAPRLADLDSDGAPEVIVVETDLNKGARLSVYNAKGLLAATPYIGQTHRWLAPIGAADFDGDGQIEIVYVDRPHLAKTIRLWRYHQGQLSHVADLPGFTNHRIGDKAISGGLRDCGQGPEMIVLTADWSQIAAVSFKGVFRHRTLGPNSGAPALKAALACAT